MKINFKNSVLSFVLIAILKVYGQQDPLYTQYFNNFQIINPAFAGSNDVFTATINARNQWSGEPDSPETLSFSLHGPVGKKVGLGLLVINDRVHVLNETDVYVDFSYTVKASDKASLAFGINAGGSFLNVDLLELGIVNDPLFNENINQFNPNFGTGVFYYTEKFYAGLSAMNILNTSRYRSQDHLITKASDATSYYMTTGYDYEINETFTLKPSIMIRAASGSPISTDLSMRLLWNNKLEMGLSHRIDESISGLFQLRLNNNFKLGYSYDYMLHNLNNYNNGSHEISLIFAFKKRAKGTIEKKTPFYW